MHRLIGFVVCASCLALTPFVWGMSAPMSPEEMVENSSHIVTGEITEVVCAGVPQDGATATVTPFVATLTVSSVEKGEAITTATLPFSTTIYTSEANIPMCADTGPVYLLGDTGTFHLQHDAIQDVYTLTSSFDGFVADAGSVGEDLPDCSAGEESIAPDSGCAGGAAGGSTGLALLTLGLAGLFWRRRLLS